MDSPLYLLEMDYETSHLRELCSKIVLTKPRRQVDNTVCQWKDLDYSCRYKETEMTENKEYEKDYSLLRKMGPDTTVGTNLTGASGGAEYELVALTESFTIVKSKDGTEYSVYRYLMRLAPLFWLEGKPVYKDDKVYYKNKSNEYSPVSVIRRADELAFGAILIAIGGITLNQSWACTLSELSWTKPKCMVKKEAYVVVERPWYGESTPYVHLYANPCAALAKKELLGENCISFDIVKWQEE